MSLDELKKWCMEYRSPESDFLDQEPKDILNTVELWLADPTAQTWEINWLLIGEVAKTQVLRDAVNEMIWAKIAVLAYEHLAAVELKHYDGNMLDAMRVRAKLILKYGNQPDDFLRDLRKVTEWGQQRTLTLEQAQAIFEDDSSRDEKTAQMLHDLDKVRILLWLLDAGLLSHDQDLDDWVNFEDIVARRWFNRGRKFD